MTLKHYNITADAAPSQFVEDPFRFYELCFTTEIQEEDGDVRRAGAGPRTKGWMDAPLLHSRLTLWI